MENRNPQLQRAIKVLGARQRQHTQAVRPQPTKLVDKTFYLNLRVDGMSGINQLVDANTKKIVGITNFDGNILNSGRDVVIDAIRLQFTTTGEKLESANWQSRDTLPAELQNADLRLIQTNDMLIDLPLTDTQSFKNEDYRPIATTPLLRAKEEFKLELEFPKGVTVPAAKIGGGMFLRLEFRVTEAKK
ncbi:hypothetical protein [Flavobacterium sp.]|uniref:hypothetical protein n=1 Tax=Flavobacterium sp. TaxID=239 RepID=UPI003D6BD69C